MPSCGHIRVLKIIHSLELLTRLEVQCGLGNSVGIKMFFHNFAMKCSNLNSRNYMYYCRLCLYYVLFVAVVKVVMMWDLHLLYGYIWFGVCV